MLYSGAVESRKIFIYLPIWNMSLLCLLLSYFARHFTIQWAPDYAHHQIWLSFYIFLYFSSLLFIHLYIFLAFFLYISAHLTFYIRNKKVPTHTYLLLFLLPQSHCKCSFCFSGNSSQKDTKGYIKSVHYLHIHAYNYISNKRILNANYFWHLLNL